MKRFLGLIAPALLVGWIGAAAAQTAANRASLETQNNTFVYTNGMGAVTAATLNPLLGNYAASMATLLDANVFLATQTYLAAPIFAGLTGYCYANGNSPISCSTSINGASIAGTNTLALSLLQQIPQRSVLGNQFGAQGNVGAPWTVPNSTDTIIPLVHGAVASGDYACFSDSLGTLKDCGPIADNFAATAPISVSFPSGIPTFALNYDPAYFTLSGNNLTLAASGVTAGTYGDGTHSTQVTFDAKGRATSASSVTITHASGDLAAANNLSDLQSATTARTNLGLGNLATQNAGTGLAISAGNLNLQPGTASTIGGVKANAGTTGQFVSGVAADGSLVYSTPSGAGNVTGTGASIVGNLPSFNNTTATGIGDSGVPGSAVDITLQRYDSLCGTAGHNCDSAIAAAEAALPASGGNIVMPCGEYDIATPQTIGNGTSSAYSTTYGIHFIARGANTIPPFISGLPTTACVRFKWTGASGGVMWTVAGPLGGWGFQDILFDGNNTANYGIIATSALFGRNYNISFTGFKVVAIMSNTKTATGPLAGGANSASNIYDGVYIVLSDFANNIGILLDADSNTTGLTSDTYADNWRNVNIIWSSATNTQYGVYFKGVDTIHMDGLYMFGTSNANSCGVTYDYSDYSGVVPGGVSLTNANVFGTNLGHEFCSVGSPGTGVSPNFVGSLSRVNGVTYPTNIPNLLLGLPQKFAADVKLAGQTTAVGPVTILTAPFTGLYRVCVYMAISAIGSGSNNVSLALGWGDGINTKSHSIGTLTANDQANVLFGCPSIWVVAGQAITYTTTFLNGSGTPAYNLNATVETLN